MLLFLPVLSPSLFWDSLLFLQIGRPCTWLWSGTPLCGCSTVSLPIYPLVDFGIAGSNHMQMRMETWQLYGLWMWGSGSQYTEGLRVGCLKKGHRLAFPTLCSAGSGFVLKGLKNAPHFWRFPIHISLLSALRRPAVRKMQCLRTNLVIQPPVPSGLAMTIDLSWGQFDEHSPWQWCCQHMRGSVHSQSCHLHSLAHHSSGLMYFHNWLTMF